MKIIIALVIATMSMHSVSAQIHWSETKDWKLYKAKTSILFKSTPDSLALMNAYPLNRDSIIAFLNESTILPKETPVAAWMGGFAATFKYDGKLRKLLISSYGGYVFDSESKRYYQLPSERKDEWFEYINSCASNL
jgi:hypothetical protein